MERLFRLLLLGSFLEAGTFTTETKLDYLCLLGHVLVALRNDALHIAALGSNEATGDLELAFVGDLDVIPARILDCAVIGSCTIRITVDGRVLLLVCPLRLTCLEPRCREHRAYSREEILGVCL